MALSDAAQVNQILHDHQYVLLVFPPHDNGDCAASALALKQYAESLGKHVEIASSGFTLPRGLGFLPRAETIKPTLTEVQKFIVKVDVSKAPIETLSYDIADGWLSIYLSPKSGVITKNELRTAQSNFKYDSIIVLGAPDLGSLGDLYQNNSDLFYRVPIVNIDYRANNERFGQVNYLALNASSVTEVVCTLIKQVADHAVTGQLATTLLAGMTAATKSFTTPSVSPATLRLASELVERGADREKIITNLYRTRSVGILKLWGLALARLTNDRSANTIYTTITREDFVRTGETEGSLSGLVAELMGNAPEAKRALILYESTAVENASRVNGLLSVGPTDNALELTKQFNGVGTAHEARFSIVGLALGAAEARVLEVLRNQK